MEHLNENSVLEIIYAKSHMRRVEWTPKILAACMGLPASPDVVKRCRKLMKPLWCDGKLLRRAATRNGQSVSDRLAA